MIDFNDSHIINSHNIQPTTNPKPLNVLRGSSAIVTKDDKGNVREADTTVALVYGVAVYPYELIRR